MKTYPGLNIEGKNALIVGGTSGIGRAIALGFAEAGANVVTGSRSQEKVEAFGKELAALGSTHAVTTMDVADEKSIEAACAFAQEKLGRIDTVINAAGIIKKQPSIEMPAEEFDRIVRVNLTGSFLVAQHAARIMKDQVPVDGGSERGSITFIASLNSYISLSEVLAYAASKSGVLGLVRGLANEWASLGIRVNAIAPGVIPTDLNRPLIEGTPRGEWLKKHTPLDRFGTADEMVGAAIYLASPSASYTTGHTVVIDGGFLTRGV